jgi:membrane associated rhomboid family serine protease
MSDDEHRHWRAIRRGSSRRQLTEASLVLTAVDVTHVISKDDELEDWCLKVPEEVAPAAIAHLETYQLENRPLPPPPVPDQLDSGTLGVLGFLLVIWAVPFFQANDLFGWDWRSIGRVEAGLVADGQWWRVVTALTLHADLPHILGNSAFGAVFGLFAGRFLGSGLAWLLILVGGALGNAVAAGFRPDEFRAIGASTATFAALALSSGYVWRRGYFRGRGWRRAFAPLFGAIALLSFTGVGGEDTDVLAHFTGFGVGLLLGLWAADWNIRWLGRIGQKFCAAAALLLLIVAWSLAGATGSVSIPGQ